MEHAPSDDVRLRALREATPAASIAMQAREARWRRAGLILGALVSAVIAYSTLMPVVRPLPPASGLDKIAHFIGFALLIFPVIVTDTRRWFWAVPLAVAYGGLIEVIQPFVGRSGDWLDWGADISGVLAGAALAEMLHDRLRGQMLPAGPTAQDVADRIEADRAELIEDLRAVLREELAVIQRPGDPPVPAPVPETRPETRH